MSVAALKERLRQINVKDPNATTMIRDIITELDDQTPTSIAVGTLTADDFTLTNTSWDDLTFPAAGLNPPGAASDPDRDTTFGYLLFDASGTEIVTGAVQLPHAWKAGTTLKPHIHWAKSTSAVGDVYWRLEYRWAPIGEVWDAAWTTVNTTDVIAATPDTDTANKHMITSFGDIAATGKTLSDMIIWRVSRVGGEATDTYGADAILLEFDIHYEIDSLGSDEEYSES